VDDDEGAAAVAVGMGIFFGGAAVRGPAGMADAEGAVEGGVGYDGFEVAELSGGSAEGQAFGASGYGDAGGVVAAVFEAAQAFNDDGDDGLGTNVTDNSTHEMSLVGSGEFCAAEGVGLLGQAGGLLDDRVKMASICRSLPVVGSRKEGSRSQRSKPFVVMAACICGMRVSPS
jgi:hypothetical protein